MILRTFQMYRREVMDNDTKATVAGVVGGIALLVAQFGIQVSGEVMSAITAVVVVVLGYLMNKQKKE